MTQQNNQTQLKERLLAHADELLDAIKTYTNLDGVDLDRLDHYEELRYMVGSILARHQIILLQQYNKNNIELINKIMNINQ